MTAERIAELENCIEQGDQMALKERQESQLIMQKMKQEFELEKSSAIFEKEQISTRLIVVQQKLTEEISLNESLKLEKSQIELDMRTILEEKNSMITNLEQKVFRLEQAEAATKEQMESFIDKLNEKTRIVLSLEESLKEKSKVVEDLNVAMSKLQQQAKQDEKLRMEAQLNLEQEHRINVQKLKQDYDLQLRLLTKESESILAEKQLLLSKLNQTENKHLQLRQEIMVHPSIEQLQSRIVQLEQENQELADIIHQMRQDMESTALNNGNLLSNPHGLQHIRFESIIREQETTIQTLQEQLADRGNRTNGDYYAECQTLRSKLQTAVQELKNMSIEKQRLLDVSNAARAMLKKPRSVDIGVQGFLV
jgi:hypothetical protein